MRDEQIRMQTEYKSRIVEREERIEAMEEQLL